jgi:hypothetical protein
VKKLLTVIGVAALGAMPAIAATAAETHPLHLGSPKTAFTNEPIGIQTCNAYSLPALGAAWEGQTISDIPFVEISFVNRYESAAKKVRFALRSGAHSEVLVDNGTFSSGTTITHLFAPSSADPNGVQCAVESVAFADGSTWARGGPPQ